MPYAPGIQNISGQLLAQGIGQATDGAVQGYQQYHENQTKDKAARGIVMGILSQSPDLAKSAGEETGKLLEKFQAGNTGRDDNVYLAGLLATAAKQKGEKLQQQQQQMQIQAGQQQLAEQARQQQFGKTLDQFNSGVGGGVLKPQMQNNPYFQQAAQLRQATGETPNAAVLAQMQEAQMRNNALRVGKPQKAPLVEQNFPGGIRALQSPDTGAFSVLPKSAAEEADIESAKTVAKSDGEYLNSIPVAAEQARSVLPRIARMKQLYAQGAETGSGQEYMNNLTGYLTRAGLYDPKKQATKEELETLATRDQFDNAMTMLAHTGPQSDADARRIERVSSSIGKSRGANIAALNFTQALGQRKIDFENERRKLVDKNDMSSKQQTEYLRRWQSDNTIDSYIDKVESADKSHEDALQILRENGIK